MTSFISLDDHTVEVFGASRRALEVSFTQSLYTKENRGIALGGDAPASILEVYTLLE